MDLFNGSLLVKVKRTYFNLLVVSIFFCQVVYAQNLTKQSKLTPIFTDLFNGMPIAKPEHEVVGETYLVNRWQPVTLQLFTIENEVTGYVAKYDLYSFELHFKLNNEVRSLTQNELKNFVIQDSLPRHFLSAKNFELNGAPLIGFFEVLVEGEFPLLTYHYLLIKKPDFNPALNAGSRDTRIFKKADTYTANGKALIKLKNKKDLYSVVGSKGEAIKKYCKINLLSLDENADAVKIFTYLNSLKE